MVLCSIASGLSFGALGVITSLYFIRFWHDFGIDRGYPFSTTITREYANKKTCGAFIAIVFTMQGLGIIVFATFKNRFQAPPSGCFKFGLRPVGGEEREGGSSGHIEGFADGDQGAGEGGADYVVQHLLTLLAPPYNAPGEHHLHLIGGDLPGAPSLDMPRDLGSDRAIYNLNTPRGPKADPLLAISLLSFFINIGEHYNFGAIGEYLNKHVDYRMLFEIIFFFQRRCTMGPLPPLTTVSSCPLLGTTPSSSGISPRTPPRYP
ncbi:hypothetical protein ZIOFF_018106 [Zingiber officinale]|uniref:Uncharacterized protein n=1 Tax=Zingiber officinale TaxID=94328 RepID=A0A8J5LQ59_ZINOF|nr:hypothetical protein ZIOFF_018106 [Zingiber officinale]